MRRLLLLLLLPLSAIAAPVPKDAAKEKMKRLYGEVADGKKGYDFTLDGDKLVVTMAAGVAEKLTDPPPRAEQEVTGDFEATATLTLVPPNKKYEQAGKLPYLAAGLWVYGKDGKYACHAALFGSVGFGGVAADGNEWESGNYSRWFAKGADEAVGGWAINQKYRPCQELRLRVRREGGKLAYAESGDGKEWKLFTPRESDLPETVRIGVFGLNTTNAECTTTFSDFSVTPLKPAEKK